ncbi:MAG: AraC family transcriptional regulator [Lentisphaeraceae bacterium]|nr:AraC family transcriptional regulator [Lentisphaeraceae bacterium]
MKNNWQQEFYEELADPGQLTALFDCMSDVYFYAKNIHSKFVMANASILKLWGVEDLQSFIGKTDYDYFDKSLADLYVSEDAKVLGGETIINRRWMVPDNDGQMNWYLSTKLPLKDKTGKIIGLCGLLRDLNKSGKEFKPFYDLSEVIDYIGKNFRQQIKVKTLADILGLSVSQLDRKFKDFTGVSPSTYIIKVRLAAVASALLNTDKTISQLAFDNGFYDHSQLSRLFKSHYKVSPTQYRKKRN